MILRKKNYISILLDVLELTLLVTATASSVYSQSNDYTSLRGGTGNGYEYLEENNDFRFNPRFVVGGKEAIENRFPYQVALMDASNNIFCSGSLIDSRWVLSAAHCYSPVLTRVYVGLHNLTAANNTLMTTMSGEDHIEAINITRQIQHPNYDPSLDYDFLLLELERPSSFTPVQMDDGSFKLKNKQKLSVSGWGSTSKRGGPTSNVLMEAELLKFSTDKCNRRYRKYGNSKVTSRMVCATQEGADSCQGDSGGPLIIKGADSSEDILVGIVSW
eukprot:CAMPEP_0178948174 /NCGR_PEP_ID=MMETSP0789-20121207/5323_1 /TAXON_ID=3005 /ORGANISM="Rhizosolenia setigera, Strain CCMP 1694" /LENGTH=273 /DNA_ID=CAMNT_0020628505 /DNA_START=1265 /DNA_END=2084 /DNA_ORIENTATION=+